MRPMRRADKVCTDQGKIDDFLAHAHVGFLGLADSEYPYVVPVNFVWYRNKIYFHGAAEGKKADLMRNATSAAFTVCEEYGIMAGPVPAHTSTAYMSVMIFGKAGCLIDRDEARDAMQQMLDKYVPDYFNRPLARTHLEKYRSSKGSATAIYCLEPDMLTAKEQPLDEDKKYVPGMKAGRNEK
ncbi:pyridoxamine 5'-phosphate oxidase family protein [Sporolactobacillus sp. CPB3-1]|uniref:Pyridoxamine 5'-phosphate oxidase family protein n=1 Tax=Sporolactobacillus mangiferae TaxID=2940498 RepID=A0ABT0M9T6_9BACL|nr:pyridoxamine 5'-phosphate oxidase family protein [Sporolactobacillus mangiferae]MCL1631632.1 pyridoxamine 5'-phosphate oxidase family protein [Sporolactobacillus mangiferae]